MKRVRYYFQVLYDTAFPLVYFYIKFDTNVFKLFSMRSQLLETFLRSGLIFTVFTTNCVTVICGN